MKNASKSTADLIYTAWVDAGSPDPNASNPVELTSFTVNATLGNITLSWKTVTESNNRGYEIQRKFDGNNWIDYYVMKAGENFVQARKMILMK